MKFRHVVRTSVGWLALVKVNSLALAADWPRFRDADGAAVINEETHISLKWSETANLQWKVELPGAGSHLAAVAT